MSRLYYLSSFDPIVDSDIKFLNDPALYFPVLKDGNEVVFMLDSNHSTEDCIRKKMIQSIYPGREIILSPIHDSESLKEFLDELDDSSYLVMEEKLYKEWTGPIIEPTLIPSKVLLLSDKKQLSPSYSQISYLGRMEREEARNGTYLWTQKPVLDLIGENALYFMRNIKEMISEHRYLHSLSVAKTAYEMAYRNGLNPILCYHAGLLHDMAKDYDPSKAMDIMKSEFPSFLPCPGFALHQFIGAYLARTIYHAPKDVVDMIQYHCTGRAEMTRYMKCLYSADEVEPLREFETEEKRRRCMENLDDGFLHLVEKQVEYFKSRHIDYNEYFLTREKYQYYLKNKE